MRVTGAHLSQEIVVNGVKTPSYFLSWTEETNMSASDCTLLVSCWHSVQVQQHLLHWLLFTYTCVRIIQVSAEWRRTLLTIHVIIRGIIYCQQKEKWCPHEMQPRCVAANQDDDDTLCSVSFCRPQFFHHFSAHCLPNSSLKQMTAFNVTCQVNL